MGHTLNLFYCCHKLEPWISYGKLFLSTTSISTDRMIISLVLSPRLKMWNTTYLKKRSMQLICLNGNSRLLEIREIIGNNAKGRI